MLEASISRQRLLNVSRRPALQRVAHLLCELIARREAIGINGVVIPLSQIDLADATGLSVVHVNRTVQGLRTLGILSPDSHAIEISDRERLIKLAGFDGRYLNMPQILSHWQISLERGSMTAARLGRRQGPPGAVAKGSIRSIAERHTA
jgi:hypothetical protein